MKKKKGIKNSDPTVLGIVSPGSYGSGLSSGGGPVGSSLVQIIGPATVKEAKRKAVSVTTPPDMSPSHQPRKVSLTTESPSHSSNRSTPTSPLVNAKLSGIPPGPREHNSNSSLGTSNGGTVFATPLPKVNIAMEDAPLDRQGIIDITVNIQSFMAAISKLKKAMEESSDVLRSSTQSPDSLTNSEPGDSSVAANDEILNHLSDLIEVVQTCLSEHGGMQSTEIRDTAKALTQTYKECKHDNSGTCPSCNNAIEALITAFTNSVSEYLTGESPQNESYPVSSRELQPPRKGLERANLKGLSKSHDNLSAKYSSFVDLCQPFSEPILEDIDHALFGVENSTDVAGKYIKMRMKYHKEIVAYLTKRAHIEHRYMNSMTGLGKKTMTNLVEMCEEHPPPLSDVFMRSVEEDMKLSTAFHTTFNQQVNGQLIEPLEAKILECDKRKKEMTNNWNKEKKKLNEAKTAMRNAMSRYRFLGQDLSRVKSLLALDPYGKQAEKRKKEVSDLESKWQEAEQTYKTAVANCNDCQYQVHIAAQKSILCAYRRMVIDCDIQLQSGLESYFRLQRHCFESLPEPVDWLLEETGKYKIGSEFMGYIRRHPEEREEPEDYLFEEFDPESESLMEANENYMETTSSSLPNSTSTESTFLNPGAEDAHERASSPFPSSYSQHEHTTPTHGLSAGGEQLPRGSASVLSISSPRLPKKKTRPHSELMELGVQGDNQKNSVIRRNSDHNSIQTTTTTKDSLSPPAVITQPQWQQQLVPTQGSVVYSKNALTHSFKKLRTPSRCRECDTYVYFHGHECETCGLACHKKCLENLAIRCGNKRLARKMNTFGVDFHKHLKATNRCVPIIVTKCIEEIDERALDTRGLYRISSAKTKLEHLCQLFESGADRVDLSDRPSHLIGSCLKLYFRQLPEPLLTFQYYHDFITFARECSYVLPCNLETVTGEKKERALEMLDRLRGLLQRLPFQNYITLARLLYHLKKVSDPEHVKHNSMPPSNLGIVFGPNLLRQREMVASLALLADMTAQAKTIEIMISHAHDLFKMTEEKIKEHEHERDDDNFTQEMLVGEEHYEPPDPIKSPLLDVDDFLTAGSRTPYNTPPERRRENVYELGEVLEALQSVGKKNEEELHKPMSSLRDHPMSTSLPNFSPFALPKIVGVEESTLTSLGRFLRSPAAPAPGPMEKMLTPVEEKREQDYNVLNSSDDEDDEDFIVSSSSNKIDGPSLSRSCSAFSNPGPTLDINSEKYGLWVTDGSAARSAELSSPRNREVRVQIQDEQKELLSQSSEDSNTFEEGMPANLRSYFAELSSSAEETPKQKSLDAGRQRHSVLSASEMPSSPFQRNINKGGGSSPQKSQSLRGRFSAPQQHSQSTFSNSCAAIIVGGSFSEKSRTKKYSISEKYARYEQCRSERELLGSKEESKEKKKEDELMMLATDSGAQQQTAQEKKEVASESSADVEEGTEQSNDDVEHDSDVDEEHKEGDISASPEGGLELNRRLLEVRELSSAAKQCDSGIDDTPDSSKSFKDGVRRLSMPPTDDDVQLDDSKPLSHTAAFASCESGIADSPIPDLPLDDTTFPKAQKSPLQQHQSSLLQRQLVIDETEQKLDTEETSGKKSLQNPYTPRHSSCIEIIVPDENEEKETKITPVVRRRICSSFSTERDRGSSVPRSLESPTFSRYARKPIRDSKLLRASDSQSNEGVGLRFRSVSMDKIPTSYMEIKSSREDEKVDDFRQKVSSESSSGHGVARSKSPGIPNSLSASFIPYCSPPRSLAIVGAAAAGGKPSAAAIDGHPSIRYLVNSPPESTTSPPPQTSPSHGPSHTSSTTQSAPSTPIVETFFSSPTSSPLSRRKAKLGKGLKQKLKPALRVFKITSGTSADLRPSEILSQTPPIEEDEEGSERDAMVSSTKSCPAPERGSGNVIVGRRVRMVSPEAVEERLQSSKAFLRRSRSSEDILDVGSEDEDDGDEEQGGETKIGGLVVVPESKHKSRGKKFLSKMKLRKTDSRESESPQLHFGGSEVGRGVAGEPGARGSPVLLAYGFVAQADGTGMKSPKNPKKRQRTPQYV